MGALADAVLAAGGEIIGVIPGLLADAEVAHPGLTELRVTRTMHERKAMMAELAGGFIALPGGIGTLEELIEQLTWAQLGRHRKPILIACYTRGGPDDADARPRMVASVGQIVAAAFA